MLLNVTVAQWLLGFVLIVSSLGVILLRKPVHACLSFLMTLLMLAALYLQLSAQFIAVMQILVYAGAILVIFMFVIILFQDAHEQLSQYKAKSSSMLIGIAAGAFLLTFDFLGSQLLGIEAPKGNVPEGFGTIQALGKALYVDFFFPFEAVILLFLIALVGALYIGKKEI